MSRTKKGPMAMPWSRLPCHTVVHRMRLGGEDLLSMPSSLFELNTCVTCCQMHVSSYLEFAPIPWRQDPVGHRRASHAEYVLFPPCPPPPPPSLGNTKLWTQSRVSAFWARGSTVDPFVPNCNWDSSCKWYDVLCCCTRIGTILAKLQAWGYTEKNVEDEI